MYFLYLPSLKPAGSSSKGGWQQFVAMDWPGFILSTGSLVCLVAGLTFGGSTWAWSDGRTIATLIMFGVLLLLTVIQQRLHLFTTIEARMVPPGRIIRNRCQVLLNIQTATTVANIYIPLYYIPLYFQFVHGDSAMMAAIRLLPFILILVTTNMAAGFFLVKIGYYWALYLVTGVLMTLGGALMYTVTSTSSAATIYGYSILLAIGSGLTFQAGYAIAGVKASQKGWSSTDIQRAVSLQNISQIGGTLLTLLICGQIFQSLAALNLGDALGGQGFSAADIRGAVTGVHSEVFRTLSPELVVRATEAITEAMRKIYVLSILAGALSLISALFMKKERLFGMKAGVGGG